MSKLKDANDVGSAAVETHPSSAAANDDAALAFRPLDVSGLGRTDFDIGDASLMRDSFSATATAEVMDRAFHAGLAHSTEGISPAGLTAAYVDWYLHLALSPGKQFELSQKALRKWVRFNRYLLAATVAPGQAEPCIEPLAQDRRFSSEAWQSWPFNAIYQAFLLQQQWWHNASCGVRGLNRRHARIVEFTNRQLLDVWSPSNFLMTNPELLKATHEQLGLNLVRGAMNFATDVADSVSGASRQGAITHAVGKDVAATPGKVVYRNDLMELIHYEARGARVKAEPLLIVPAWIMKYYILDLSPHNSMVGFLLEQGFDVFMISWRNPGPEHRNFGFDDYRRLGPLKALDIIEKVTGEDRVHAAGYCLGGTLLAVTAAAMARDGDDRLASTTLLAAQTDFSQPGELGLFIGESQLSFLEDMMWEQGFLDARQMAGAFQLLRSNDLIWSRMVREYLLGTREEGNDLMSWNADATRMPYRMHSEYLRQLFLDNDLSEGRFRIDGRVVSLRDIEAPLFVVATTKDHVSPWHSVYRIHQLADAPVTFALTNGGHNGGIVSQPGHPHRRYQLSTRQDGERYVEPEGWAASTPTHQGSWWFAWAKWLNERMRAEHGEVRMRTVADARWSKSLPEPIGDAPGLYVHER